MTPDSKKSACSAGNQSLIPGSGIYPWRRKLQPTSVFLPGDSHGQKSLVGLQYMESQRVRCDWVTNFYTVYIYIHTLYICILCICMYVSMYMYILCICMYVCICIYYICCIYVYIYIYCICVYIYIYIYLPIQKIKWSGNRTNSPVVDSWNWKYVIS